MYGMFVSVCVFCDGKQRKKGDIKSYRPNLMRQLQNAFQNPIVCLSH